MYIYVYTFYIHIVNYKLANMFQNFLHEEGEGKAVLAVYIVTKGDISAVHY